MESDEQKSADACPHCSAPFDQGHVPGCPALTAYQQKYADRPEPRSNNRHELSRADFSKERLGDLRQGFEEFRVDNPETLAFGLIGSMVQGRATEESDIDGYLFLDAGTALTQHPEASLETKKYQPRNTGILTETTFDQGTQDRYASFFRDTVLEGSANLNEDKLQHLFVRPISNEIIDANIQDFMDLIDRIEDWAAKRDERQKFITEGGAEENAPAVPDKPPLMQVSPNLVSLFVLQLGHGLDSYREYLIRKLSEMGPYGELIWKGIGRNLEITEQGTQTDKKYPRTLDEARKKYLK